MPFAGPHAFSEKELREDFKLEEAEIKAIEAMQLERNPNWKKGDKLLTKFSEVSHKTGFAPGNF